MQRYLQTAPASTASRMKGRKPGVWPPLPLLRESRIPKPPPPSPSSRGQVWKSTLGSWKERPFRSIGNSTGKCHYILSGGCLWCLKGGHSPAKVKAVAKNNSGASQSQTHTYVNTHTHTHTHTHTCACIHTDIHILAHSLNRTRGQNRHGTSKPLALSPPDPPTGGGSDPISWSWDLEELKAPLLSPSSNHRL